MLIIRVFSLSFLVSYFIFDQGKEQTKFFSFKYSQERSLNTKAERFCYLRGKEKNLLFFFC